MTTPIAILIVASFVLQIMVIIGAYLIHRELAKITIKQDMQSRESEKEDKS